LSKRSEHFYRDFLKGCKIPVIIWGVGMCLPQGNTKIMEGIDKNVARELESRCDLINVRDDLTAHYYDFKNADVSPCPTVVYVQKFRHLVNKNSNTVIYSSHDHLVPEAQNTAIISIITQHVQSVKIMHNLFD